MQAIWREFSSRSLNLIPVAAYSASEHQTRASAVERENTNVEGNDNILRWATFFITSRIRIHLPVTVMRPVCSIQLVCFTQTEVDAHTNPGASRCKDEKKFNKAAANLKEYRLQ